MNTRELQSIIELSKSLSFRETAERLFISQPALSYQINDVENEIGFRIFERSGKAVSLTPAGRVFVKDVENIYRQLQLAIERGQNFSSHYEKEIRIGLPRRAYYSDLPIAIEKMGEVYPEVAIAPVFSPNDLTDGFLKGDLDLVIGDEEDFKGVKGSKQIPLYRSPIKLLARKDDVLTKLPVVTKENIVGRTLLVGSVSRKNLRKLQLALENEGVVKTMNSDSHDTTLTLVSAGKAICLSPEFYKAEGGDCAWLDYDTDAYVQISLLSREGERRPEVLKFIELLK
ncbi:MAG: LysR family transcriptional regulator [Clostridia bacterium]|nr:LysR family transcriptional regulator [Clostridia bacterium]